MGNMKSWNLIGWELGNISDFANNVTRPRIHFKIVDIVMKKQQEKMALIFFIVDVFGRLNMEIYSVFSRKSAGEFGFSFRCIVKKLLSE